MYIWLSVDEDDTKVQLSYGFLGRVFINFSLKRCFTIYKLMKSLFLRLVWVDFGPSCKKLTFVGLFRYGMA